MSPSVRLLSVVLTLFLLSPAVTSAQEAVPGTSAPLVFLSDQPGLMSEAEPTRRMGPLKEGHTTVIWSEAPQASGYRLLDDSGNALYEGRFAQAFVSGLPDGEHAFRVVALDRSGEAVAEGPAPLTILVGHWDQGMAWMLFILGAVVMLVLAVVLVIGTVRDEGTPAGADGGGQ